MKILLIIFLVLMVSHKVLTNRLVENTTCLELAEPSHQQFRLTCSQYNYHCLLDETFTKEFEVCREWKWIPGGKCAYFNTYGHGNVDERECKPGINLTCSESKHQFESYKNTQFTACYEKRDSVTSISTSTSTFQVTPSQTLHGDVETPSSTSKIWFGLPIGLGIIFPSLSLCVIYSFFMRLKATKQGAKDCENASSNSQSNTPERDSEVSAGKDKERNDDKKEKEPLLKNSQTERQKIEGAKDCEKAGSNSQSNAPGRDSELSAGAKDCEKAGSNSQSNAPEQDSEVSADNINEGQKNEEKSGKSTASLDPLKSENEKDRKRESADEFYDANDRLPSGSIGNKEHLAKSSSRPDLHLSKYDDNDENEEKSTDVFDDTIESLRITPITDEKAKSMCTKLFHLLDTEGLKLTQQVMAATITRETGKSVNILINNLTDEEKSKLKKMLPEETHRILESKQEHGSSFYVSYGLHRIFLDGKHHPKSGWGNPVRGKDIGIGDDVERLYRIQTIVCGISDPVAVSVESYIRLLDIMVEALTRLDTVREFKKNYKILSTELAYIKNQTFTHKMIKDIQYLLAMW